MVFPRCGWPKTEITIFLQEMKMSTDANFSAFVYFFIFDLKSFYEWNKQTQVFFGIIHAHSL